VLSAERDSLVVEMKDNQFEFMTLVVGEYDSLYNLVGKKQLDTVDVKGFKGVIPLNRYSYRSVIRGFAKNYHWIKFESTRRLSEGRVIYFEYRRD
jgi:hypothetical protein